jgi:hypothetical protein
MKLLEDTSPEARRVLIQAYRSMSAERKWEVIADAQRTARILHAASVRSRQPLATPAQIRADWVRSALGERPTLEPLEEMPMNEAGSESLQVLRDVVGVLRAMKIGHALGGSFASSLHGVPRQTLDADLTAEPFPGREEEFVGHFGAAYYVELEAVQRAVRDRSCFNLINTAAGFKVNVFIQKDRPFERMSLARRVTKPLSGAAGDEVEVFSAEDTIVQKLEWFRLGGEMSDRQWSDILGVIRVQGSKLDQPYLDYWAEQLGVADLLVKVREQQ